MNILYITTILAIFVLILIMHKTEKKQNILSWIAISTILILCYNIFSCVICTFIGKTCSFQNLSICNTIVITVLIAIILKNKKIQKYYIKISDIVFSVVLLLLVIFIAYKQYGFPLNIKYRTTDGSTHYFFAHEFYKSSTLLYKEVTYDFLGGFHADFRLPGAYVNEGILFKLFEGIVSTIDVFIIFDLFVLYMSGILFYFLLKKYTDKNKINYIIAIIFTLLYMLGYQLNSMLSGYVYLSFALVIVIAFILMMQNYKKEEISDSIALSILAVLSFGIFFSYAYFIPIIYIAIVINIIRNSLKNKEKVISIENIIKLLFLIINPLILGATYFILLPFAKGIKSEISSIVVDGAIYKNYITNLLVFIPIVIVWAIKLIKNRKKENENKDEEQYATILFIMSILFVIVLFIGKMMGKVSAYYFFKAYYIVWPLALFNIFRVLLNILKEPNKVLKIFTYAYISMYIVVLLTSTLIFKKSIGINDVFATNLDEFINREYLLEKGEINILGKVEEQIQKHSIFILHSKYGGRTKWMARVHENEYVYDQQLFCQEYTIENWLEERQTSFYLAFYKDYELFEDVNLDENSDEYEIIYNDEYGFILERRY